MCVRNIMSLYREDCERVYVFFYKACGVMVWDLYVGVCVIKKK